MSRLGEREIIGIFQKGLGIRGAPEDVESFFIGKGRAVANVDTMVQSTDMPSKMTVRDAARKSIIACASDFVAKGARPRYGVISLTLPRGTSRYKIRQMALGVKQSSMELGIKILGGDTNEGKEIAFHVCIFGAAKKIIPRNGARPDEIIFTTGPFGHTAAGLEILEGRARAARKFRRIAVKSFARPSLRLDFALRNKRYFSSSMDSSDGLSATLNEMARQSRCRFAIDSMPTGKDLKRFAKLNKIDAEKLVFHGGEEYEFVFTVQKKHRGAIQRNALLTGTPVFEIGSVLKGSGVFVKKNNGVRRLHDLGWRHFK